MEKRKITVYRGSTKDHGPVPRISLQGQWLEGLGFSIGDRLTVSCGQGRLTIEKDGERTECIEIGMVAEVAVRHGESGRGRRGVTA